MGIVHPKEPSELAKKTFSGMVVMNYYPVVSKKTLERMRAYQEEQRQAEAESKAKQKLEEEEGLSGRQVVATGEGYKIVADCELEEEV